jgi:hypothetical protein
VNHFIVSFGDTELTDEQSARVKSAIEMAAKKEYESIAATSDALPITQLPTAPGPVTHPGRGPSNPGGPGNTSPSKPGGNPGTGPIDGVGNPIGKHQFPIVKPAFYDSSTKTWKAA